MEKPGRGRAVVNDLGDRLQVVIPTRRNIFITIFLGVWLAGWATGLITVSATLFGGRTENGVDAFLLFWLAGWLVAGVAVISVLVWTLAGKEVITLSPLSLKIEVGALNIKFRKEYSFSEVRNLRQTPVYSPALTWSPRFWPGGYRSTGTLAFDYGMRTVYFAAGIDEAEAGYILDLFLKRNPRLGKERKEAF